MSEGASGFRPIAPHPERTETLRKPMTGRRKTATSGEVADQDRRPKPRPLAWKRGQIKREKILRAAAAAFAERGYSATTLSDIAAAAGTQAGSLYYHFDSRDDITREVLKSSMTTVMAQVREAWAGLPADAPAIQRIRVGVKVHIRAILSDDPFLAAFNRIINEVPLAIREEFAQHPRAYGDLWREVLIESRASGEIRASVAPSAARMLLFGSINGLAGWYRPTGECSADEIADMVVDIFCNGMLSEEGKAAAAEPAPALSLI